MKSKASPHLTSTHLTYKWLQVVTSAYKWFYVVKSGVMWLSGSMWLSGFMWLKVVENDEKWGKLGKIGGKW